MSADWESIYRLCAPSLRRFIRSRVPEAFVEDTLQDTFVRAYRSRARYDPARPALPWLLTIARRACAETLHKLPPEMPGEVVDLVLAPAQDEPHIQYENRQRIEQMRGALTGLSPRHRRLLLAWDVDGRSPYPVLAAKEGISNKALKSALCRARTAFRHRYSILAERTGVAAAVAWAPARLRARMQRAWMAWMTGAPVAEAALGGIAVIVVSVAVVVGPTTAQLDQVQHVSAVPAVHPVDPSSSAGPPAPLSRAPVASPAAAPTGATTSRGGRRSAETLPTTAEISPVAARTGAVVRPDIAEATTTFTIEAHHSMGPTTLNHKTVIYCDTPVRRTVCDVGQETPLAR